MGLVSKFAGHNSPLFGRREEDEVEHPGHNFNVNDTIAWWLSEVPETFVLEIISVASSSLSLCPGSSRWKADCWNAYLWTRLGAHGREWGNDIETICYGKYFPRTGCSAWQQETAHAGRTLANLASSDITRSCKLSTMTRESGKLWLEYWKNNLGWCVAQFQNLHSLPWLPGATPKAWETVVDGCYLAPYITNGPWWVDY